MLELDRRFVTWATRNRDGQFTRQAYYGIQEFALDVVQAAEDFAKENNIDWHSEYAEGFTYDIEEGEAGFLDRFEISFGNEAEHALFVAKGSAGNPDLKVPPPDLMEWVAANLSVPPSAIFPIARSIMRKGTQESQHSNLRNLPPSGEKGFNMLMALDMNGTLPELVAEYTEELGRKIKEIFVL